MYPCSLLCTRWLRPTGNLLTTLHRTSKERNCCVKWVVVLIYICMFFSKLNVYRNKNMKLPVETGSLVVTQVTLAAFYFTLNSQVLLTVTLGLVFLAEKVS